MAFDHLWNSHALNVNPAINPPLLSVSHCSKHQFFFMQSKKSASIKVSCFAHSFVHYFSFQHQGCTAAAIQSGYLYCCFTSHKFQISIYSIHLANSPAVNILTTGLLPCASGYLVRFSLSAANEWLRPSSHLTTYSLEPDLFLSLTDYVLRKPELRQFQVQDVSQGSDLWWKGKQARAARQAQWSLSQRTRMSLNKYVCQRCLASCWHDQIFASSFLSFTRSRLPWEKRGIWNESLRIWPDHKSGKTVLPLPPAAS